SPTPASCPTCSRRAAASSRRADSSPTAPSPRARCSPSTTRTTCRPRRPRRCGAPGIRWVRRHSSNRRTNEPRRGGTQMIAEFGQYTLALALAVAAVLGTLPMLGSFARGTAGARLLAVDRPAALLLAALATVAFFSLGMLFVRNDFSVLLVATHSNLHLPLHYRIAATWGSHEGSMLLWVLILSCWTGAVAVFSGSLPGLLRARILATMGLVGVGFLLFLLFTSNPFERLVPPPADGRDLNPLLQDAGMVFHPPLLYMGYVGLSVAFAFSVAGLIGGRFDAAWARWARPWTTVAWCFLTLGIALGSFWAYYELG